MKDEKHRCQLVLIALLLVLHIPDSESQFSKLKLSKPRVGSSKFSLNPLKPLMKLVRDPLKASAQRHYSKYLPPPPGMFQPPPAPPRVSVTSSGNSPWQRYYSTPVKTSLPLHSTSLMPQMTALPSSLVFSMLDRHNYYNKPSSYSSLSSLPSDVHIKTLKLPSRYRKTSPISSTANMNLADSVVRQLLDIPNSDNMPSVLVIEDPDVSAASAASSHSDMFSSDSYGAPQKPTILVAPPINAGDISDSSADLSALSSTNNNNNHNNNPDVFVIVSKNKNKGFFAEESKKTADILSTASSSPKMKKYKISSSGLEDIGNSGSRQVWIIKR